MAVVGLSLQRAGKGREGGGMPAAAAVQQVSAAGHSSE